MSSNRFSDEDKKRFIERFEQSINDLKNINSFYDNIKAKYGSVLQATNEYTKSHLERINRNIQSLRGKFDELKSVVDDLTSQIASKDNNVQENNAKINECEQAKNQLLTEIQNFKNKVAQLEQQIAPLQQQNAQFQSENENLKNQGTQSSKERASFQEQLANIQKSNDDKIRQLVAERDNCLQKMQQMQEPYDKLNNDINALRAENNKLLEENNNLIQRIVNATSEIKKASDYLNELMKSTDVNPETRQLLDAIEKSIQEISNYVNGSRATVGGKKSRKSRKQKKTKNTKKKRNLKKTRKNKNQKGGFLYKKTNRKSLHSYFSKV